MCILQDLRKTKIFKTNQFQSDLSQVQTFQPICHLYILHTSLTIKINQFNHIIQLNKPLKKIRDRKTQTENKINSKRFNRKRKQKVKIQHKIKGRKQQVKIQHKIKGCAIHTPIENFCLLIFFNSFDLTAKNSKNM